MNPSPEDMRKGAFADYAVDRRLSLSRHVGGPRSRVASRDDETCVIGILPQQVSH